MATAGYVREFSNLPINGVGGPKYRAKEVTEIVEQFRAMTEEAATNEMKTLLGYARSKQSNTGDVLCCSLEGTIRPTGIDLSRPGLRGLYYQN